MLNKAKASDLKQWALLNCYLAGFLMTKELHVKKNAEKKQLFFAVMFNVRYKSISTDHFQDELLISG